MGMSSETRAPVLPIFFAGVQLGLVPHPPIRMSQSFDSSHLWPYFCADFTSSRVLAKATKTSGGRKTGRTRPFFTEKTTKHMVAEKQEGQTNLPWRKHGENNHHLVERPTSRRQLRPPSGFDRFPRGLVED